VLGVVKMSSFGWKENIKIDVTNLDGSLIDTTEFHNKVTNTGLNWLADGLRSTIRVNSLQYLGWGSGNVAVATTDIQLSTEKGRKLLTSQTSSNTGVCISICYIGPTEATTDIEELAWFAGSSASATVNSGRMMSRVLYSRTKTALESLTITRTDTFTCT
jgi:hypothetical protein